MIRAVPNVAAMASYALADLGDTSAVSLAQNESAHPPSPAARAAGARAIETAALYPDPDWRDLRRAIAAVHPVAADDILCGAGSMELIGALIRAFAGPGDTVLGSQYGYLFVATAAEQAGAAYVTAPEPELRVCVDGLLSRVDATTRLVFLCNPGNPTGTRIANAEIVQLRDALPKDVLLVVDQAYGEFDEQDHAPIFALVGRGDTIVTRTFSKAYALAGLRVGWGAFPPAIGAEVRKLLNPNNISGASQAMATAAMADQTHMARIVGETAALRDTTAERLRAAGYDLPVSHANFLLIRFADAATAARADAALRAAGLILRGMGGYGLTDALRATIGPPEAMDRMCATLEGLPR
ncbi:MAG: histidinol-phosphate transaminase [Paracoccaceae bacterium]|nr:histidinol-phosphate transaminase [Paracoccaceae bacterium]